MHIQNESAPEEDEGGYGAVSFLWVLSGCAICQDHRSLDLWGLTKTHFLNLNKCVKIILLYSGWGDSFGTSGSELWAFQRVKKKKKSCLYLIWETDLNLFPTKSPCILFFSMSNLIVKITCDICKSADFLDPISEILSRERDLGICIFNTKMLFISCY